MLVAVTLILLVTVALALVRAAKGPTVFDRLQSCSTIGTCAMLLLALLGFIDKRPEFLDLALTYGLLNVIGVIAVLKFFHPEKSRGKGVEKRSDTRAEES